MPAFFPGFPLVGLRCPDAPGKSIDVRFSKIEQSGWSASDLGDARLIEAEINGLDFFHRVLRPWARDPGFYQTVFAEMSDVPAHEGPSAEPNIDLYNFTWPLSAADDARLTQLLGAVPALLADGKINLVNSKAHDVWAFGDRAFTDQAEALAALETGTLSMNDLGGKRAATLNGTSPALRLAVHAAPAGNRGFRPLGQSRGAAPQRSVRHRHRQLQLVSDPRSSQPVQLRGAAHAPAARTRSLARLAAAGRSA